MIRRHAASLRLLMMLADVFVVIVSAVGLSILMFNGAWEAVWTQVLPAPWLALAVYVVIWVAILWANGVYRVQARWSVRSQARLVIRATAWIVLATASALFLLKLSDVSRAYLFALFAVQFALTLGGRMVLRWFLSELQRRGRNSRHVIVLGTGSSGVAFASNLENHPELGFRIEGFLGQPNEDLPRRWRYLGTVDDLPDVIHQRVVDEVAICLPQEDWALIDDVARLCETEGKVTRMPVAVPKLTVATAHVEEFDGTILLSMVTGPNAALALAAKRLIDIVVAAAAMVILSPLLGLLALTIVVRDGRPILFRQERVGLHGRRFQVVKFRTMTPDAEERRADLVGHNEVNGQAFKLSRDPRVTAFGAWLRRSSLDELPQLWNVLKGEMSLVGPRPPLSEEVAAYDVWHRRRLSMKPGITGLWQIEGRRDPEFDRWVQKDLEYIDRWSPWLDIKILLRTVPAVLKAEGR